MTSKQIQNYQENSTNMETIVLLEIALQLSLIREQQARMLKRLWAMPKSIKPDEPEWVTTQDLG